MARVAVARVGAVAPGAAWRVLVDRLWPRGVRKEEAPWDEWLPGVAPSAELRRWYGHDPARYPAFRERYQEELAAARAGPDVQHLLALCRRGPVVLLTATRDLEHSQVPVLAAFLAEELRREEAEGDGR